MKCLILAAGYATRLYPMTENFPKPLLEINGKTILDWLVDDINTTGFVDEFVIISNHKYVHHFYQWAKRKSITVSIVDDGTISNETRLGAVRDIQLAMNQLDLDDDLLVIAGDNLLNFSLGSFIRYAKRMNTSCVMRYFEPSVERLCKSGVLEINDEDRVLFMEEKPIFPRSPWCCPPFYCYTRNDSKLVKEAVDAGINTDAPGGLIAWLCKKTVIHAMKMPGYRFDIGTLENYMEMKEQYQGIVI